MFPCLAEGGFFRSCLYAGIYKAVPNFFILGPRRYEPPTHALQHGAIIFLSDDGRCLSGGNVMARVKVKGACVQRDDYCQFRWIDSASVASTHAGIMGFANVLCSNFVAPPHDWQFAEVLSAITCGVGP